MSQIKMMKNRSSIIEIAYFLNRWISQIFDPLKFINGLKGYCWYFRDIIKYKNMHGSEEMKIINTYPCLHDKISTTKFDSHYFYQNIWAFKRIYESKCKSHIDIGSRVDFVGFLTAVTKVTFIDIRPLNVNLDNYESKKGDIMEIPFKSGSVESLSCLHVAEHIGLGRYGDSLDPSGTKKSAKELSRVLSKGGNLFFSLPIGKPRLCFNAHRIHTVDQIIDYFQELKLIELSGINDEADFIRNISKNELNSNIYGCGLFWFQKP